jgi:hypothetical protein
MAEDYGYDDYGYGDCEPSPAVVDMGFGDENMGYGDDYGYGEGSPGASEDAATKEEKRPKRRCSVTKYSLQAEEPASALCAASVISDFRNGSNPQSLAVEQGNGDCCAKSAVTDDTLSVDGSCPEATKHGIRKKGMMHRIRKRLSIVT